MTTGTTRPMTAEERALVIARDREQMKGSRFLHWWIAGIVGLGAAYFTPVVIAFFLPPAWGEHAILLLVVSWGIVTLLAYAVIASRRIFNRQTDYRPDLAAGQVEEARYTAVRALRVVDEHEQSVDEAPAVFLEVGAGTVLFLCGEYLRDAVAAGTFPCREFTLASLPHTGELIQFTCHGGACPTEKTTDVRYIYSDHAPGDGGTLNATLATLPNVLQLESVALEDEAE